MLTPEQVDGYVAELTDAQARVRLRETLRSEAEDLQRAAQAAATASQKTGLSAMAELITTRIDRVKLRAAEARSELQNIDYHGALMLAALTDQEGWPAVAEGVGVLVLLLTLSGLAEWGFRRALKPARLRVNTALASTPLSRLGVFVSLLLFDALALSIFVIGAIVLSFVFYTKFDPMREVLITAILAIGLVRAVHLAARHLISGPERLFPVSRAFGQTLVTWTVGISALLALTLSVPPTLRHLGMPDVLSRAFVQPFTALILIATLAMMWQMRARLVRDHAAAAVPHDVETGHALATAAKVPATYYLFASAYGVIVYLVTAETSFLGDRGSAIYAYLSLILVIVAPSVVALLDRTLDQIAPPAPTLDMPSEPSAAGPSLQGRAKNALLGVAYVVILGIAFALLLETWFRGTLSFAQNEAASRFGHAVINVYLTALLAYIAWQLVEGWSHRQLAADEAARQGIVDVEDEATSVPTRSRMGTLAPLIRFTTVIALAATVIMIVLSSVGIDIAPLLAGAGVVGLAIGFGAQSLVRDILSGVFFLVDDAFRVGEYIEIDSMLRGEVERLTSRSMQLRHHRGPLLTLPYGTLRAIINHNRDFAIFKQEFRVPYDTDLEKVRKIIKKIGQEMLADPELGPKFLEPLKSQGVIRIEESALIIRTKFVCLPREQFVLRRIVYQRVQEAFHAAGIEFAFRKVHVQVDRDADDEEVRHAAAGAAMAAMAADEEQQRKPASGSDR